MTTRISWDTSLKHIIRNDLLEDILTPEQIATIPRSNISRWKHEDENKYKHCEINTVIQEEMELIKRMNQSSKVKKITQSIFKLQDTFHEIISEVKGIKTLVKKHNELVVDTIESVKDYISINQAIKVFQISRSTYENYKAIVIYKCETSYFHWCVKRFPHQLLPKEVLTIKKYMNDNKYKFWSKSSIYLKALRDKKLHCALTTFYKYCRLLGFENKPRKRKSDEYCPVKTTAPNQFWCADVTIFKTLDGTKNYIHFLMDHYSKMILGYRIEKSASGSTIRDLLKKANLKYYPKQVSFLTDGGSENVNTKVADFINQENIPIQHIVAQKDVAFSNSMIEALNKVIKHQFLYPHHPSNPSALDKLLKETVYIYNNERPQAALGGNTPFETQQGLEINFHRYTTAFCDQKNQRIQLNKKTSCTICQ